MRLSVCGTCRPTYMHTNVHVSCNYFCKMLNLQSCHNLLCSFTKADTRPQTPTTQVITEGSWSATMGIPRESATIWSSFQADLHLRVVQGSWCSLRVFWCNMFLVKKLCSCKWDSVGQMNSHSTCRKGLIQATISGTSKHCRSVFDGRSDLETLFRSPHSTRLFISLPRSSSTHLSGRC